MAESTNLSEADSVSVGKTVLTGEINENTLKNVLIPEIEKLLVERINPDFGLLDKLLGSKALSRAEYAEVKNLSTCDKKNSRLLELVTKNDKLTELFNALRDTHQEHLVNYVTAKGEYNQGYGGAWPLTEKETDILDANQESLVDLLELSTNEIIHKLYSLKVLNKRQQEFICNKSNTYEKAEALLDILYRSSLSDYWKMVTCLRDSDQGNVADILLNGGALVRVHNGVDGEGAEEVTTAEREIVDRLENMLSGMNLQDSSRLLERLQLKIFAARVGHSVNLYILCGTVDELMHLSSVLASKELQRGIEQLFNKLLSRSNKVHVLTTVSEETLNKCRAFLEVDRNQERGPSKDILKQCEQMKVEEERRTEEEEEKDAMEVEHPPDDEADEEDKDAADAHSGVEEMHEGTQETEVSAKVAALQSGYNPDMDEMLEEGAGGAEISVEEEKHRPVRTYAARTAFEVMAAIIRNNTDYFMEYINPRGLIDRLHKDGSLTDEDTRYIKTLKEDSDKNDEILKVIRVHGPEKYNVLIDLLRGLNQNLVAEVAEKGGVVLKATISNEESKDVKRVEKLLVDHLNQLLNKTSSTRSTRLVQFLSLLGRGNIQVLDAKWEFGIIVWFWCRSEKALKLIDDMNESSEEKFTKLMTELFKILLDGKEDVPEITNIDFEDPEKVFVAKTSSLCLEKELPLPNCSVCAVAVLDGKTYILCQKPSRLLIFDERGLSEQSSEVALSAIADPVDMVASQVSACLYITDRGNFCVWKFTPADNNVTSWLQNNSGPFTLSVTSNGGLIIVEEGQPSHLEIYSAAAQRINQIKLPASVKAPHHAVETSVGTYVISYGESSGANGICEITKDGNVVSVFDTLLETVDGVDSNVNKCLKDAFGENKLVCCPRYLAVNKHDEIYATDPVNGGMLVFDSRLMLEAIIEKDLFREPVNMHCVKDMRGLWIVYGGEEQQAVGMFTQKLT